MARAVHRSGLVALGIATALMASCAFAAKDVVVAVGSNFTTLDPYDANDTLSQAVAKSFYQGLFGLDKEMKLKNVLAESYTVSDDGITYTVKLREGIKFQDGTDFNAAAVKANLDRASDPANHLKRYNLYKNIAKTEAIDPTTVKITLKQPFSAFINILAHPATAMISPAALEKYGKEIGFYPVGTGPYELDTWNQTDFVKVKKFAGYWQPGLPKLDSITWRPVADNNTRAAMLQTGEAQFAFPIPYEQATLLEKNKNIELMASPSIMQRYISMNVTQKPFDNPKVREALNYAINRPALVKVAFAGYATPATGVVPPSIAYAQSYKPWPYDPVKARELLKEAGYPNGFSTTLWSSHNHSTAQKVLQFTQQQLAQVGIKAQVTAMDAGQRAAEVEGKGQKESGVRMFYTGWSASTGEADWALSPLFASQNWPPTLFIVSVLVFLFVHMLPGDPARLIAGPEADAQVIELVRQQLGLDQPLYHQFWHYISNAVQGDFGLSMVSRRPVADEIASRFMPTLWLTITSMVWAVIFGMAAGIIAAVWRNRWPDRLSMTIAVSGISFPAFALGMLLIQVFSVELGWLPTVGADSWQHYILPSLTLGAAVAAVMARFTRASFVDVLSEDYMRTARAKGVSETWVVLKHGLRNAMIPVVTMMGLQFGFLLGGSIVVEKVFNWPGLGRLLVDSVEMRDYPVIQAEILLFSLEFILINLVVDVLYAAINPAIRYK
ncbi:TPA: glutathione ABC transporter substrate-binding protein GsiB [Escherichia coli]|nr:glutathione ABC transporter substrate-binding protein GsiB [Escherichia coli]